jgi:hypothetical protein
MLDASAKSRMARLDEMAGHDFSVTWETDVKAGFHWRQAALTLPLGRGSRAFVASSGAALNGSPLSGGDAGAKRMRWAMARCANGVSTQSDLDMQCRLIVRQQRVEGTGTGTGTGDVRAKAYADLPGIPMGPFPARSGAAMPLSRSRRPGRMAAPERHLACCRRPSH